jgi:hypothetical protein
MHFSILGHRPLASSDPLATTWMSTPMLVPEAAAFKTDDTASARVDEETHLVDHAGDIDHSFGA